MLNLNQKKCVEHIEGPALVLSTAGSGKTRVIIERCKYLVEKKYCFENEILLVTFSNKAANEMEKRINSDHFDWIGTFHSISFKILQLHKVIDEKTIIIGEYDKRKIFQKLGIDESFSVINRFETTEQQIYDAKILNHYDIYKEHLVANRLIDFHQIIQIMISTLRENTKIRQLLNNKFKFIMVDEFQDINKSQYDMIKLLLNENCNLMCVGDDNQCIYPWRGARLENMIDFSREWKNAKVYYLNQNYRSTSEIVLCSQSVCDAIEYKLDKDDTFSERSGQFVSIHPCRDEPRFITSKIKKILENHSDYTIAILVRSIKQITELENALLNANIPYDVLLGNRMLEREEIKALISYIRVIYYNDYTVLDQMLSCPSRGIGPKKIEKMMSVIKDEQIIGNPLIVACESIKAFGLAEKIKEWYELKNPCEILQTIWLELKEEFTSDKYVRILIEKAKQFTKIEDFIQNLITLESEDNSKVCIMTIHSAKGLEFDAVFIPGVCEGNIPHQNAIIYNKICEERRVLYVAMTRAKDLLYLTYNPAETNGDFFGISRFLVNFPREHSIFFPLED